MMKLGQCDGATIKAIQKMFKFLIQSSYWDRFKHGCPAYLCAAKDLSFLPHIFFVIADGEE